MPTSQFTIYSSNDVSSSVMNGLTGSLTTILDACLVNGYGTKLAAGWTKVYSSGSLAGYQSNSGSQATVFINDMGPHTASLGKEAWATGWSRLTDGGGASGGVITASVGQGVGQFPLPAQLLTTGHVMIRKSSATNSTAREWILFADAYTMYLFIRSELSALWYSFWFGDIYSFSGADDMGRAMIRGGTFENTAVAASYLTDLIVTQTMGDDSDGSYIAHCYGNGVTFRSQNIFAMGNYSIAAPSQTNQANVRPMYSGIYNTNPGEYSYYIWPLLVYQPIPHYLIRGRFRGMYHIGTFTDASVNGQIIQGTGDNIGKTFYIIMLGPNNGVWCIDISNSVETN